MVIQGKYADFIVPAFHPNSVDILPPSSKSPSDCSPLKECLSFWSQDLPSLCLIPVNLGTLWASSRPQSQDPTPKLTVLTGKQSFRVRNMETGLYIKASGPGLDHETTGWHLPGITQFQQPVTSLWACPCSHL